MFSLLRLSSFGKSLAQSRRGRKVTGGGRKQFRPRLERLEDRTLPQATPTVVGSLGLGNRSGLGQVAMNPNTGRIYVASGFGPGPLQVVDASTPASPALVTSIAQGWGAVVNPVTNRYYTADGYGGNVLVYDSNTNTQITSVHVGYIPGGFAIDTTKNLIYVTCQGGSLNDPLFVLDGATNTIIAGPLGSGGVNSFPYVNPTTGRSYDDRSGGAREYNSANTFVADLSWGVVGVNPVTNRLYTRSASTGADLQVRDGTTEALLATIVGAAPGQVGVNTNLNRLYVNDPTINGIDVYDGATNVALGSVVLGANVNPQSIAVDSVNNRVAVAGILPDGTITLFVLQDSGKTVPTVTVTDTGGTYTGRPFTANATATGTGGVTVNGSFSYTYYVGSSTSGTGSATAPINAGTYTVVASFTSTDSNYANAQSAPLTFTITPAAPLTSYNFTKIAGPGSQGPFAGVVPLDSGSSINDAGTVAFVGTVPGSTAWAVYAASGGSFTSIAVPGQTPLASGGALYSLGDPALPGPALGAITANGSVVVDGSDASNHQSGVFAGSGGPLVTIAPPTTVSDTVYPGYGGTSMNNAGTLAVVYGSDHSVGTGSGGTVTPLYPHVGATRAVINNAGTVAYQDGGLKTGNGGPLTTIAASYSQTNGTGYSLSPDFGLNDSGAVAFMATLLTSSVQTGSGVFTGNGGPVATVAQTSANGFYGFGQVAINNAGTIAFEGGYGNSPYVNSGVFTGPNPVTNKVIGINDPLFGSTVVAVYFGSFGLNNKGQIAFIAELANGTVNPDNVIAVATPVAVALTDAGGSYNGSPYPASATVKGLDGNPINGSFTYTYYVGSSASGTGSTTAPTNAGTYTVVASFTSTDSNYANAQSAPVTFTIGQASPTVTLFGGGGAYDGQPHSALATVSGVGGATVNGTFSYTYYVGASVSGTGSSTAPTNAGTYTVVASFTSSDPNYSNTQSAPVTFTITPVKPLTLYNFTEVAGPNSSGLFTGVALVGGDAASINDAGAVAFIGTGVPASAGNPVDWGIFRASGGSFTPIAVPGQTALAGGGTLYGINLAGEFLGSLTNNGTVVVGGRSSTDNYSPGVFAGTGGPLTALVPPGTSISDDPGYSGFSMNDAGALAVTWGSPSTPSEPPGSGGTVSGGSATVLYNANGQGLQAVAALVNNAGTMAYAMGYQSSYDGVQVDALYTGKHGPLTKIIDQSPFGGLRAFALNDSGTVAFTGPVGQPGSTVEGLFTGDGGPLNLIAATAGGGLRIGNVAINDTGTIAFEANFGGPYKGYLTTNGIFTGANPISDKVIALGDSLFGSTVSLVSLSRFGLNKLGQIAFAAGLDNGTTVIAVATPVAVALTDAGGSYNGSPFPASATVTGRDGKPINGSFTYTYYSGSSASGTGSATAPTNVGTYTVVAAFTSNDPNYTNAQSAPVTFTITAPVPAVTAIAPNAGPVIGGTLVTITGTNLAGATAVSFGSLPGTIVSTSATQIQVTSPPNSVNNDGTRTVDVTVTTANGTSAIVAADQFTWEGIPILSSVSPATGPAAGGTQVTITGAGLLYPTAVDFGSTPATSIVSASATKIVAVSPPGTSGAVHVTVVAPGGTSFNSAADLFNYTGTSGSAPIITGITPSAGPVAGGTQVTIAGTNLTGATAVNFGTLPATSILSVSATQIMAVSPPTSVSNDGTRTVDVTVTTANGSSASTAADQFTYTGTSTGSFAGSYVGTYSGNIAGTGGSQAVNGDVAFAVDGSGNVVVTSPVGGQGHCDGQGNVTVTGAGTFDGVPNVSYAFTGTIVLSSGGGASVSGNWTATFQGGSGSGTLTATQQLATPTQIAPSGVITNASPTFRWTPVPGAIGYEVWVNDVTSGPVLLQDVKMITDTSCTLNAPLLPGRQYQWWVRASSNNGTTSAWSGSMAFTVALLGTPTPILPVGPITSTTPNFTWSPVTGADTYELWVDDLTARQRSLPDVKAITTTSYTPGTSLTVGDTYQWWVRASSNNGNTSLWSDAAVFAVIVGVPTPANPSGGVQNATPAFTWSAAANADFYDVWVDDTTSGKRQVLRNQDVTGTTWTPTTPLTPGDNYQWWVRGLSNSGVSSLWSTGATFTVAPLATPTLIAPSLSAPNATPTFSWNAVIGADSYEVWIDDLTAGQAPLLDAKNVTTTSLTPATPLTQGDNYRWFVKAYSNNGDYSPWSGPTAFTVPLLGQPTLTAPLGPISNTTPTFTWNVMSGAASYEVWLNDLTGGPSPLLDVKNITTTSCTPTTPLTVGHTYQWWVKGQVWSSSATFAVIVASPTPANPSGAVANATPAFRWNAAANADYYDVWVDDTTTSQAQVLRNTHVTGTTWTPTTPLTPGDNYQWWVRGLSNSGVSSLWSSGTAFTVTPLAIPTQLGPGGSSATASPLFSWNAVTGADYYTVRLDDLTAGQSPWQVRQHLSGTSFTDQLTLGHNYQWFVQAWSNNGDASPLSAAMPFTVTALPAPALQGPLAALSATTSVFTWSAVHGADHYDLWVNDTTSGQQVLRNQNVTGTSLAAPAALTTGDSYQWWARALDNNGNPGPWSNPAMFTITANPSVTASFSSANKSLNVLAAPNGDNVTIQQVGTDIVVNGATVPGGSGPQGEVQLSDLATIQIQTTTASANPTATVSLNLGSVVDVNVNSALPIASLTAVQWIDPAPIFITAPSLAALAILGNPSNNIAGNFGAGLILTGAPAGQQTLGNVSIAGTVTGGTWSVAGPAGAIAAGATGANWSANIVGALTSFTTNGNASGTLAAAAIGTVQVKGDLTGAHILAGANLGADAQLGGTGVNADKFSSGTIGIVSVLGQIVNSVIGAGLDPVDGIFGNGNDAIQGGLASSIGALAISGAASGASYLATGTFGTPPTLGGLPVQLQDLKSLLGSAGITAVAVGLLDHPPRISINDVFQTEGDAKNKTFTFTVQVLGDIQSPLVVNYKTIDGFDVNSTLVAAKGGKGDSDYDKIDLATLVFPPGKGQASLPIQVTVHGNTKDEADKWFAVNLSLPPGEDAVVAKGTGVGVIVNDDTPITIGNAVPAPAGLTGTNKTFAFPVTLAHPSSVDVHVQYQTVDGSATAAENDYNPIPASAGGALATLTIPTGQLWKDDNGIPVLVGTPVTSGTIDVQVNGDSKLEPTENFFVQLVNPTNAKLGDGTQGQGTILGIPAVSINDVKDTEGLPGTTKNFAFTVTVTPPATVPLTVEYDTLDGSATTVGDADYGGNVNSLTIPAGQPTATISVPVFGDGDLAGTSENFFVKLNYVSDAIIVKALGTGTIVNTGLAVPTPLAPFGTISATTPTFKWTAVTGADHYDVWVDDTSSGQKQVLRNQNATGTSWTASAALTPGDSYEWWVQALNNSGGGSNWSNGMAFTIQSTSGAAAVTITSATLTYTGPFGLTLSNYAVSISGTATGPVGASLVLRENLSVIFGETINYGAWSDGSRGASQPATTSWTWSFGFTAGSKPFTYGGADIELLDSGDNLIAATSTGQLASS